MRIPPPPALRLTVRLSRSLVDGEWVRVPLLFPDAVAYGVKVSLDLMRPIPGVSFDPDTSTLEFVGPSDGSADIRVTPVHDWDNEDERVEFGMPQSMESSLGGGVDGGRSIVLYIEDIDGDSQESVEINADEISLKEGKEETYRVHLNGPPYSTVTVTAKVSDPSRAQVKINSTSADKSTDFGSQRSLTISSNDWSTITSIHSITVKALNDNVLGDPAVIEIEHAISGPNFEAKGRANKIVRVYIEEVGKPAASISGPEEVQEGRTVPFEVSLSSAAHQGVEVGYSISGTAVAGMDYSGSVSGNLTFAAGEQMKTLEVPTTLDTVADDGETLVVTLTGSTNASVDSSSGTATTAIRDLQLTVAPSQNQFVLEGDTIVYNLRANYPALKDYTFSVAVTDGTATGGSAPGSGVDFDDSATELVLRAGETGTVLRTDTFKDSVDEPLENFTVSISHAEQLFEPQTFMEFTQTPREFTQMLSILDQDPISISISADRVAIAENGGRANITVALSRLLGSTEEAFFVYLDFADGITGIGEDFRLEPPSSPPANVDFVNFDTTDPVGDPPYVSFRSGSTVRSVTFGLVAIDDVVNEGSHENVSIAIGSGSRYKSGITNKFYGGWEAEAGEGRVQLRITDDDIGGVTVTETEGGTFVSEDGMDTDSYDVVLISVPTDNVTVTVIPGDTAAATVNPASLTFTPGNWNEPQTVTVRGVDDVVAQAADRSVVISHTATSTDPVYEGIMIDPVTVTVTDDDGFAGVTITELGGNTEMAEGDSDSYDVVLMALPDGDVTITTEVRNRDPNTEGDVITLSPASLTFTPGNWNQPQTVTVNAVDDTGFTSRLDAHKATIRHSASGGGYDRVGIRDVEVTVWDRDEFGVRFSETDGATVVSEDNLSDSYTVVLKSPPPDENMPSVVSIVSSDATAMAVDAAMLTFTAANWNKPQTVTVRGVDDALVQDTGRRHATLRHSITNYPMGANRFNDDPKPVLLRDIQVVVLDAKSVAVTETDGGTSVSEGGTETDSYDVVLTSEPTGDVTVTVTSDDTAVATVNPTSLTFTTSNWSEPQTVTVTGVDDTVDQVADRTAVISHVATSTDTNYGGIMIDPVTVTVRDDDNAGVAVTETDGGTSVSEGGTETDSYDVVLTSEPTGDVTVTVTSDDTAVATVNPTSLTFTTSNWSEPQTVTVTGVDDTVDQVADRTAVISHVATSTDTNYGGIMIDPVTVTVRDDDNAGVAVTETDGGTSVSEGGTETDSYDVVLTSEPTGDVTVTVTSDDTAVATVNPTSLTFTTSNWSEPQTVTVTGVDDTVDQVADRTAVISHVATSTDTNYGGIMIDPVTVTVRDDDNAGVAVTETDGGTSVSEGGTETDSYDVVLTLEPTGDVTVTVTSDDTAVATVNPTSLTFTTSNWSEPQTVTVTGVDDTVDQVADRTAVISHVATSTDTNYGGIMIDPVTVTVRDDDNAGVAVTETDGGTSVSEGGTETDSYDVVLTLEPTGDVTVTVTSDDTAVATVNPTSLTFTTSNWSEPQTVTVTGVDDTVDQVADRTAVISHVATSTDTNYGGIMIDPVTVTVRDDDNAGVAVTETDGGTSVSEGGTETDSYDVVLTLEPTGDVTVTVTSDDTAVATVNPTSLTFTTSNWSEPQTVTVTGVDDTVDQVADRTAVISHVATSTDTNYGGIMIDPVTVTVRDDDNAGVAVTETDGGTSVSEGGTETDSYDVVLTLEPTGDVTVTVTSDDTAVATVNPTSLTFTTSNWSEPQTVTVTGVDDTVDQVADRTAVISHVATSTDTNYGGIMIDPVTVTVRDDDNAGVAVTETDGGTSVSEGGTETDSYDVVLTLEPTGDVTVTVTSDDTAVATVNPTSLTFTTSNWSEPQTVTVTGVDDTVDQVADRTAVISHVATSTDTNYGGIMIDPVTVTVRDDDNAGVAVTETDGGTSVSEGGTETDSYDVVLTSEPTGDVTVTVTSDDTAVATVNPTSLTFTTSNWSEPQTVTVTGVDDTVDQVADRTAVISHVATSTDTNYGGIMIDPVTVTVRDDDGMDLAQTVLQSALPRIGRTVSQQVVEGVLARVGDPRSPGFRGSMAGRELLDVAFCDEILSGPECGQGRSGKGSRLEALSSVNGFMEVESQILDDWRAGEESDSTDESTELTMEEIIAGTAFALTARNGTDASISVWGRGAKSGFQSTDRGAEGTLTLEGEVNSFMLGSDWNRDAWMFGLMLSHSRGDVSYATASDGGGKLKTDLTALIPYLGWKTGESLSGWAAIGLGSGDLTIAHGDQAPLETGFDWTMAAGGLHGTLGSARILGETDIGWSADVLWTRTDSGAVHQLTATSGEISRIRLGLDGTWSSQSLWGGTLTPSLEAGIRYDGGHAETGFGLEIGVGGDWQSDSIPGLSLGLEGRTLVIHEDGDFKDWGLALIVSWDPHPETNQGISASLKGNVGAASSGGVAALFEPEAFPKAADSWEGVWSAEIAHGVDLGKGMVGSSYAELTSGNSIDGIRLGYRLEPDLGRNQEYSVDVWAESATNDGGRGGIKSAGLNLETRW